MIPLSLSLSPSTILLGQLASHTFSPGTAAEGACQPVGFFSVWLTIWSAHLASLQGVCVCVCMQAPVSQGRGVVSLLCA